MMLVVMTCQATQRVPGDNLVLIDNYSDTLAQVGTEVDGEFVGAQCLKYFGKQQNRADIVQLLSTAGLKAVVDQVVETRKAQVAQAKAGGVLKNSALDMLKPELKNATRLRFTKKTSTATSSAECTASPIRAIAGKAVCDDKITKVTGESTVPGDEEPDGPPGALTIPVKRAG